MRAPQSNPRSPHDVATARMYQRRKQLGLPRREACASARILKFVTFTLGTDPPRFAPPQLLKSQRESGGGAQTRRGAPLCTAHLSPCPHKFLRSKNAFVVSAIWI